MTNKRVRYRVIAGAAYSTSWSRRVTASSGVMRWAKRKYTPRNRGSPIMVYDIGIVQPQELLGHEIIYYLVMPKILNRLLALVAAQDHAVLLHLRKGIRELGSFNNLVI